MAHISDTVEPEPVDACVTVCHRDPFAYPMRFKLNSCLLGTLLVKLIRVDVAGWHDCLDERVRQRPAARA